MRAAGLAVSTDDLPTDHTADEGIEDNPWGLVWNEEDAWGDDDDDDDDLWGDDGLLSL